MKILILSVGTRVKVVEYFTKVKELEVICADASEYAPALYAGDTGYVIPRVNEPGYFEAVLAICERENVDGMLSLIDPEIAFLSKREAYFKKLGVTMIMPPKEEVWRCFDKREMYEYCVENQIQTIPTYSRLCDFEEAYLTGKIKFPVFVKPAQGSGSISIQQVNDFEELRQIDMEDMMIQTLMTGPEYGIDAYCDLLTGDVVEIFIKEKIKMASGETEKARSTRQPEIETLVRDFLEKSNCRGPIDIDVFEHQGAYYLSEVNPRFGGGYPFAHACGADFPKLITKNLAGEANQSTNFTYPEDIKLIKYCEIKKVMPEVVLENLKLVESVQ